MPRKSPKAADFRGIFVCADAREIAENAINCRDLQLAQKSAKAMQVNGLGGKCPE